MLVSPLVTVGREFRKGETMFKSCSRCGKVHPSSYVCTANRFKRDYADTEERKLRSTNKWTEKSKEIRERANHLCEVCRDQNIYNYKNIEVHHIKKIREDRGGLLDNDNLICLCQEHHKQADKNEISSEYLTSLARKREGG